VVSNLYGTFPKSVVVQVMCKMTCKKYYVDISTSAVYQTRWTNCLYWFFPPVKPVLAYTISKTLKNVG